MTIQEEIKLWLSGFLAVTGSDGISRGGFEDADKLLEYLTEQGVVIQVKREIGKNPYRDTDFHLSVAFDEGKYSLFNAGYVATEPLIL